MKNLILMTAIMALAAGGVSAGTINVDVNDPACVSGSGQPDPYAVVYCNIQDAITDATAGDVVNVADGTYGADPATGRCAYITKDGLSLIGESETGTIIDGAIGGVGSSGSYWPKGIHIQANNVTIQNFTVQGFTGDLVSTGGYGVLHRDYAHDTPGEGYVFYDGCSVDHVTVHSGYSVVYALCFTNLTVTDCYLHDNYSDGMFIARGSDGAIIHDNVVTNSGDQGIWVGKCWSGLDPSDNATIYNNTVNGAREGGICFVGSDGAEIYGNSITNAASEGWSVGALNLKDGPTNVNAYSNRIFDNDGAWNGYAGLGHGVGIDGGAGNINLHDNAIYGNTGLGVYNISTKNSSGTWETRLIEDELPSTPEHMTSGSSDKGTRGLVLAEDNWWGDVSGPYNATTNPSATGDAVSDDVDYSPWWGADYVDDPHTSPWTWYVNISNNSTIQEGIDAASASVSDVINVAAGTYREQLYVDHSLDLLGAGVGISIIEAPDPVDRTTYPVTQWTGDVRTIDAVIGIVAAGNVNISGFTVDGRDVGPDNFYGVHFFDTDGSVTYCTVDNITDAATPSNSRVVSVVATHSLGQIFTIDFSSNSIPVFQKGGILIMGPGATFSVNENTVVNVPSPVIAGNGIQLSYGATGTTYQNVVQGAEYTGDDWAATGILLFESGDISMDGDEVYNCQSGVNFSDWGWVYLHPSPVNLNFTNLNLYDNEWTLGIQLSRDNSDVNMTVTDCDVLNSTGDGIDLYCTGEDPWGGSYYTGWENGDLNATITGCYVSGTALDGIWGGDYSGNVNNVSVSVYDCMFTGNVGSAINNGFTQIMDASGCYWDDPTGPTIGVKSGGTRSVAPVVSPFGGKLPEKAGSASTGLIASDKGSGETIYGNIDYTPWLGGGSPTSPGFEGDFATLWVDDDSPQSGATGRIQEGIDLVSGSTVNVAAGTYTITSTINVNKEVTITGDTGSPANVIVQYSPADITQTIFEIQASNVTIEGIKTISGRYAVAFTAGNPTGCTISHCILDQPGKRGINFWSGCGTGHTVEYTTISNVGPSADADPGGECGIVIIGPGARTITIQHNTFTNMYRGIWVYNCNSIVIDDNTFTSIKDQGHTGNEFSGAPAIHLHNSAATSTANRVEVTNNTVSDCYWQGIFVYICPYTYVYNNTVYNCNYYGIDGTGDWDYAGIHVQESNDGTEHSDHCIVDGNTVYDCINGIQIWADDCQVTNNEIYDMGKTYANEKVVGLRTYKNSGILVGSNFGNPAIDHDPTGVVIQDNSMHDNYWGLFYSADLSNGVNASGNWLGDNTPSGVAAQVSGNVDYTPWLDMGTDTEPGVPGFQGDFATLWVDDDSPQFGEAGRIQEGVDLVTGSTVNVTAGTYTITSAIDVNKGVTITGDTGNPENVLVRYATPQSINNGFEIGAANITIQGIKVVNCKHGFFFDRSNTTYTGCTITHCAVETASNCGIGEIATPSTTISYNTITDCGDKGIYVRYCESASEATRTEIIGNTLSDCSMSWGCSCIQTFGSKYVHIYDNTISSTNDKGINIIRSNATGTSDRIQVIGNTISLCKYPGIQAIGSPYTYVYNNTLAQCNYHGADGTGDWDYASIHIEDDGAISGANVIISGNTISDGVNGIQTWANDVIIIANEIYDMGLTYADEKTVGSRTYKNTGILVGSNFGNPATDHDPTGVVIQDNSIHDNYWGLFYSADLSNGVNASGNNWGASDGPEDTDGTDEASIGQCFPVESMLNIVAEFFPTEGLGNAVSDNVNYCPWIPWSCCAIRGDIDHSGVLPIDIADLVYLVDYMFNEGPTPVCWGEGDVDGSGVEPIDIADLVYLVDYMFNEGPEPPPCP